MRRRLLVEKIDDLEKEDIGVAKFQGGIVGHFYFTPFELFKAKESKEQNALIDYKLEIIKQKLYTLIK